MAGLTEIDIPEDSLLAKFGAQTAYRDCLVKTVQGEVTLQDHIAGFYSSHAFRPERLLLGLIGKGASREDLDKLARAETESFAAWNVVERNDRELLMQDYTGATASWLAVRSSGRGQTDLLFGSWVGKPDRPLVKALMPFHRFYARLLLSAAA